MAVKLILSFDTEDYETPASDDAEKGWAEMLMRYGLTGCFCVVGEEARALRDRGRRDVLAALARHEVAYHSDLHSAHPTHAEYLDTMGWPEGVRAVLEGEAQGIGDLRSLLGQQPSAYCKPGNSWGPQVSYAIPCSIAPSRPCAYLPQSSLACWSGAQRMPPSMARSLWRFRCVLCLVRRHRRWAYSRGQLRWPPGLRPRRCARPTQRPA